jgi:hypothetical protein
MDVLGSVTDILFNFFCKLSEQGNSVLSLKSSEVLLTTGAGSEDRVNFNLSGVSITGENRFNIIEELIN